jgi:Asp-tRNA(Asn)/Glu-tRNA(Gln) amidotransferase C subunit
MKIRFAAALFALALPVLAQAPAANAAVENTFYKAFWMEKGERNFAGAMALYDQFLKESPTHPLAKNAAEYQFALLTKTGKQKEAAEFAKTHEKLLGNVAVGAPAPQRGEGGEHGEEGERGEGAPQRGNPQDRVAALKKQLEEAKAAGDEAKVKQLETQLQRAERMAQAGGQQGGPGGQGGAGAGGRGGRGGGMFGTKKLTEMSAEELDQFKTGLERMSGMVEMMRERNPEQAKTMEENLQSLQKSLDANKLEDAQKSLDKMREAMPQRGGRGGRGGGGGGEAGGPPAGGGGRGQGGGGRGPGGEAGGPPAGGGGGGTNGGGGGGN